MDSDTKQETVSLTPEESEFFAEIDRTLLELQQQGRGALALAIRQRNLPGKWRLHGNQLVRAE